MIKVSIYANQWQVFIIDVSQKRSISIQCTGASKINGLRVARRTFRIEILLAQLSKEVALYLYSFRSWF
jgi:hypothetical protein